MSEKRKETLITNASAACACLCVALALAVNVFAQQKPNIANDVEREKKSSPKDVDSKPTKEGRPAPRRVHAPPRRAAASLLTVTFLTSLPGADLFLNAGASPQKIGKTGADGKLVTRLPRGRHDVTASRPGARATRRHIDVQPGRTTFSFDLTGADGANSGAPDATRAASADEVFKRFLDPRQTDSVTLADWQLAQTQAAALYAQTPFDPMATAQSLFAEGQVAYLRGDYASALVAFNNAALTLPNSALAYYGLGNAYLATNQLGEASRAYNHAAKLNPNMALAYKGAGDVLSKQGKDKEALGYYERARSLGYVSPALDLTVARSLLKQRRWQQALNVLLEVAKTKPSAEVYIGVGDSYVGIRQPLSAAAAYRQAAQTDPKSALAHYKYGELSFQMREHAAALEALERALALDPAGAIINRARAREMADRAAERLGRKE